ncbi:MAG: hypothetical protein JNK46_17185 [Methylobacteriaceae bacterium]|nr:hypothetical protein [Methylobacteriaceae bacterium]
MTHPLLLLAAAFMAGLAVAHSLLGEKWLIGPLVAEETRAGLLVRSRFALRVLRFAWHLTSVAFLGLAAPLVVYAFAAIDAPARLALRLVGASLLVMGAVVLASSRGRHLAWPFFLGAGAIAATA